MLMEILGKGIDGRDPASFIATFGWPLMWPGGWHRHMKQGRASFYRPSFCPSRLLCLHQAGSVPGSGDKRSHEHYLAGAHGLVGEHYPGVWQPLTLDTEPSTSPGRSRWRHIQIGGGGSNHGRLPRGDGIWLGHRKDNPTGYEEVREKHSGWENMGAELEWWENARWAGIVKEVLVWLQAGSVWNWAPQLSLWKPRGSDFLLPGWWRWVCRGSLASVGCTLPLGTGRLEALVQRWGLWEVIHEVCGAVGWWWVTSDGGASSGILARLPPGMYLCPLLANFFSLPIDSFGSPMSSS